jgi:hypothetical protein
MYLVTCIAFAREHGLTNVANDAEKELLAYQEACQAMLNYEESMDGADGFGENDDKYFEAIQKIRTAVSHLTPRVADGATGFCECGYMAKYPICTKCGRAYPPRR